MLRCAARNTHTQHTLNAQQQQPTQQQRTRLDRLEHGDGLDAGGGAEAVADHGLGAVHLEVLRVGEHLFDGLDLGDVADERRRRVRVDVVDLFLCVCDSVVV